MSVPHILTFGLRPGYGNDAASPDSQTEEFIRFARQGFLGICQVLDLVSEETSLKIQGQVCMNIGILEVSSTKVNWDATTIMNEDDIDDEKDDFDEDAGDSDE